MRPSIQPEDGSLISPGIEAARSALAVMNSPRVDAFPGQQPHSRYSYSYAAEPMNAPLASITCCGHMRISYRVRRALGGFSQAACQPLLGGRQQQGQQPTDDAKQACFGYARIYSGLLDRGRRDKAVSGEQALRGAAGSRVGGCCFCSGGGAPADRGCSIDTGRRGTTRLLHLEDDSGGGGGGGGGGGLHGIEG